MGTQTKQGDPEAVNGGRAAGVESFGSNTPCSQESSDGKQRGTGIQTIRPRIRKKGMVSQDVNKEPVQEPKRGCLETAANVKHSWAAVQKEAIEHFKVMRKFESQGASSLDLDSGKLDKEILERGILQESRRPMGGGVPGEVVEKIFFFKKSFTRGLTDMSGKLVDEIRNVSGAEVRVIFSKSRSPGIEEVVMLKGPLRSVEKAEQMLLELLSSAKEKNLSSDEKKALMGGKKKCLLAQLRGRSQVPVSYQGGKLFLFGKPEETKKAEEMFEEELKNILGD